MHNNQQGDKETHMQALLFRHNGEVETIKLRDFLQVQYVVGGFVEMINDVENGKIFLVNEDATVYDLPRNKTYPQLLGDVILADEQEFRQLPFGMKGV